MMWYEYAYIWNQSGCRFVVCHLCRQLFTNTLTSAADKFVMKFLKAAIAVDWKNILPCDDTHRAQHRESQIQPKNFTTLWDSIKNDLKQNWIWKIDFQHTNTKNFELSLSLFYDDFIRTECMYFCIIRVCMKLKSKANVWIKHNNNKLNTTTMQWESFIDASDEEAVLWNIFDFFVTIKNGFNFT